MNRYRNPFADRSGTRSRTVATCGTFRIGDPPTAGDETKWTLYPHSERHSCAADSHRHPVWVSLCSRSPTSLIRERNVQRNIILLSSMRTTYVQSWKKITIDCSAEIALTTYEAWSPSSTMGLMKLKVNCERSPQHLYCP
jgi:hypothetical protein